MKKLLLGLGTLASIAAPVAAVVACGSTPEAKFVDPSDIQKPALEALATSITADDTKASGLTDKEIKVKGDTVQITLSKPSTTGGSADPADTPEIVAARYTADLSTKTLTSVEYKNEGESFVAADAADLATLKTAIDAHVETAVTAIKDAEDAALETAKTTAIASLDTITDLPADAKTAATTAINAATDQAGIDAALATAQAAATPAPAQGGHSGSTADIDQTAVNAEQTVVNGLSTTQINSFDRGTFSDGTLTDSKLTEAGITGFVKKDGFSYDIKADSDTQVTITVSCGSLTASNVQSITLNIKPAGTPAGNPGAPAGNPGAPDKTITGPGATASTDDAATATFDSATETMTIEVELKANDFKNHIDGLVALAVAHASGFDFDKDSGNIKHIKVTLKETGKSVDGTADVPEPIKLSDAEKALSHDEKVKQHLIPTQGQINTTINTAIAEASEKAAEALGTDAHDVSMKSKDYETTMATRINGLVLTGDDFAKANEILASVGNATRFNSATEYKPVFGAATAVTGTVKEQLTALLKPFIDLETKDAPSVATAINAQIAKLA